MTLVRKILTLALLCLITVSSLSAQNRHLRRLNILPDSVADVGLSSEADSLFLPFSLPDTLVRLHGNITAGMAVFQGGKNSFGYSFLHPQVTYDINERLTLGGGVAVARGFGFNSFDHHLSLPERNFAPRRNGLNTLHAEGYYRPNNHLTLAASVRYLQGDLLPSPDGRPGQALGVSAALNYRFNNGNRLSLYIDYIHTQNMPLSPYPLDYAYPLGYGYYSPYAFGSPFALHDFYLCQP